jgi:Putative transposase
VLAAGGLAPDHSRWISSRRSFFLPIKVLSRVFRGKFVAGLKSAFHTGTLQFYGNLAPLAAQGTFTSWLRLLFRHDWVVYAKRPFGGPEHALRYLSAYTHRIAISNHRLVALANGNVTFRWRDSAHANKKRLMTLPVDEFLRRFLLHLLPRGFVRIRNFGFLANRCRTALLPLCFHLFHTAGLSDCDPKKRLRRRVSQLFRKGSAGIPLPQPLWNIESLENCSQIVAKGHRPSESCLMARRSHLHRTRASTLQSGASLPPTAICDATLRSHNL